MFIEASAPTRVDLTGGTIDIPPLYLFHEGASTINFAISLRAYCRIKTRKDDRFLVESVDRNEVLESSVSQLQMLKHEKRLELIAKLIYFFKPEIGFEMTVESKVPAGAGLAGSSTLNIACIAALNRLVGERYSSERFIPIAAAIECQVIRVPTGYQDYYSAQYGGVSAIHFRPDGIFHEHIETDFEALESRFVIAYTGEPRDSGINNWEITKRHIDGEGEIFDAFEQIRDASLSMKDALLKRDWDAVAEILRFSHSQRKRLSKNITTKHMDEIIEEAFRNGAVAAQVCGAGGGGCVAFFCKEGYKEKLERRLSEVDGVKVLDWKLSRNGLELSSD
ncbi:MAG: hypothetical protein N2Z23_00505 [Pyrinomonadaceae bacterium]|nr:hypothetical protein [Pyrinomonadaceae bacterium]MCX7638914.1 hypothetical protein [Pyrinomonadaceae bacterium]